MRVQLVGVTQSLIDGVETAEELIVYAARVSNPAHQNNAQTAPNLIRYLIKHRHWSPFEMAHMMVEIETSRAIAAQILRHRSFCFQEFSQRYAEAGLGFEPVHPRRQDTQNRQNSTDDLSEDTVSWFDTANRFLTAKADSYYREALKRGVAKECARFLLPLSATTRLYMSGSCRSWLHYLSVRNEPSTQYEHRQVAQEVQSIFAEQFPNISKAMDW